MEHSRNGADGAVPQANATWQDFGSRRTAVFSFAEPITFKAHLQKRAPVEIDRFPATFHYDVGCLTRASYKTIVSYSARPSGGFNSVKFLQLLFLKNRTSQNALVHLLQPEAGIDRAPDFPVAAYIAHEKQRQKKRGAEPCGK